MYIIVLTHICLVDPSILINWMSPFPILGVSGVLVSFLFAFKYIFLLANSEDPDQTSQNIRRRVLWHLIWVCTVCLCPKNGTLGLYGLIDIFAGPGTYESLSKERRGNMMTTKDNRFRGKKTDTPGPGAYEVTYEPPHDKTNKMTCVQRRLRSAWASAQSGLSLRCPHEESLDL